MSSSSRNHSSYSGENEDPSRMTDLPQTPRDMGVAADGYRQGTQANHPNTPTMNTATQGTPTESLSHENLADPLALRAILPKGSSCEDRYLDALSEVSKLRRQPVPVDELLPKIVKAARQASGAAYAAMGVLTTDVYGESGSEPCDHIVQFIHDGIDDLTAKAIGPHPVGRGLLGKTIFEEQLVVAPDRANHPDSIALPHGHPPMKNFLGAPIEVDGRVFGNLYLAEKPDEFSDDDARLLEVLCSQAGAAIHASIMAERLRGVLLADERSRIARDMHDGVMQNLFSLGMALDFMSHELKSSTPDLAEQLSTLVDQVDETIQSIRQTIYKLRDSESDPNTVSLQQAVVTLAREYESQTRIRPSIAISAQVSARVPHTAVADVVYLIKEALNNARRHGKPTAVSVRASEEGPMIAIVIEDNGAGFDPSQLSAGHGLDNMRERAKLIGGRLKITSSPGAGTSIFLSLPSQTTKEQ